MHASSPASPAAGLSVAGASAVAYAQKLVPVTCSTARGSLARLAAFSRSAVVEMRAVRPPGPGRYSTLVSWGRPLRLIVASTPSRPAAIRARNSASVAISGNRSRRQRPALGRTPVLVPAVRGAARRGGGVGGFLWGAGRRPAPPPLPRPPWSGAG